MKTFRKMAAQGDVLFRRVDVIPANATKVTGKGPTIIAHSETGHHHAFDASASVWLYSTPDRMVSYLEVKKPEVLRHHREHDTHEALNFEPGIYEIRRQREWSPDGWHQVLD